MAADQITVTLSPGTNPTGGFEWQMSLNGAKPQGPSYPDIGVHYGHTANITFNIQNGAGQNITFTDTPMLVPPKTSALSIVKVSPSSFTIYDHNHKKVDLPYVLVFTNAPPLDPVIKNDGGGSTIFSNAVVDVVGVAVIAAILFFAGRFLIRKFLS